MVKHHGINLINAEQYEHKCIKHPEIWTKCIEIRKYNGFNKPERNTNTH